MAQSEAQILSAVKKKLEAKYKDSTELFPDLINIKKIPVIGSGSTIINTLTGVGGFPRGRVTEIYGPYGSGKTTLGCEFIAEAQRQNPKSRGLFLDYEHALDLLYARALGVDLSPERFIFAQPEYGEQGGQIAKELLAEDLLDWIIIDSAAAATPRLEIEGELDVESSQKGTHAAMMARILAITTKMINRGRKPVMLVMNQTRAKIEIGRNGPVANPGAREQSAAGNALKFYSSIRIELEIIKPEGDAGRAAKGTEQVFTQQRVRVTCIKNKVAPPFMRGQIVIKYGEGIDNISSIADLAEAHLGILSGAGYFRYTGDTPETSVSCRGRDTFLDILKQSPALQTELETKVLQGLRTEHERVMGLKVQVSGEAKQIEYDESTLVVDDEVEVEAGVEVKSNGKSKPSEIDSMAVADAD